MAVHDDCSGWLYVMAFAEWCFNMSVPGGCSEMPVPDGGSWMPVVVDVQDEVMMPKTVGESIYK